MGGEKGVLGAKEPVDKPYSEDNFSNFLAIGHLGLLYQPQYFLRACSLF